MTKQILTIVWNTISNRGNAAWLLGIATGYAVTATDLETWALVLIGMFSGLVLVPFINKYGK